jgi:ribosomal protein S18 acetylase RimI-like enzyme
MKIRKSNFSDSKSVARLMKKSDIYKFVGKDYTYDNVRKWLRHYSKNCFVAEDGGKIMGIVWFYPISSVPSGYASSFFRYARFFDLAVDGKYRRLGIGTMLVKRMFHECKKRGIKKIIAFVESDNKKVQKFNKSVGLKREGIIKELFCQHDKFVTGYIYGKVLR